MTDFTENAGELFAPLTVEKKPSFSLKDLVSDFPDSHSDWSIPEAYFCLLLSAALADGRIAEQEMEALKALAHRSRILKTLDPNELAAVNRTVVKRRADRPEWLTEACRTLPHDMHLPIFAHCLDICLADGALLAAEAEYLEKLLERLTLSQEDIRQTTRILSIKNRY